MTRQSCIILAGGLGTRLRSIVADVPKCLAPVRGRPFLYWQIASLSARGIDHFVLALGYGAHQVVQAVEAFGRGIDVECVTEPAALGTGGAISFALASAGLEEAIVANGDTILFGDLQPMLKPLSCGDGECLRIAATLVPDRARFGGINVTHDNIVFSFLEKGTQGPGRINAGLYRVRRDALPPSDGMAYSLESAVFPSLVAQRGLTAVDIAGPFIDIGVPEDYRRYCDQHELFR